MDKKVKESWLKALRSGEYQQGTDFLHQGSSFCCLGVLCDLYAKSTASGNWTVQGDNEFYTFKSSSDDVITCLPESVLKWAQMPLPSPEGAPELEYEWSESLAGLNDAGFSFNQLADYIEENF
jgi:hypothetical protein